MKIYTYYQKIEAGRFKPDNQSELIDLWKISWSRQGYEPIVLNLQDAKNHTYFKTLNTEMRRIFKEITGKAISDYGMSCWFRWLAYATQREEKFYVSDYDAININFPTKEPEDQLHLMDFACPFLASGTPRQFEQLCKLFIEISDQRIKILKEQASHYHDQEFFQYNFMPQYNDSAIDLRNEHGFLMTRNRHELGGGMDPLENKILADPYTGYIPNENRKVFHVSHANIRILQKKYTQYKNQDSSKLRIDLVKKLLGI